jgi:hypothetical protein
MGGLPYDTSSYHLCYNFGKSGPPNNPPVLDSIRSKTVKEGDTLRFRIHATDSDLDSIILSALPVPTHAVFVDSGHGSGSFVFTPDTTQSGTYNVTFKATDIKSAVDSEVVQITVTDFNDVREIHGSDEARPSQFSLSQNYPNPFNPITNFQFTLPKSVHVKIEIFNIVGQKVKTLMDQDMKPGVYQADWDGKDESGNPVSTGVYFYKVQAGDFSDMKKMVLLK